MIEFTLGTHTFKGKHLTPEKSLDGFAMLSPVLAPILDGIDWTSPDATEKLAGAIKGALNGLKDLPKFRPLFWNEYTVSVVDGNGTVRDLALSAVGDNIFKGKPALHVAWLLAAIHAEYAGFLQQDGLSILRSLAERFGFQSTQLGIGPSGA